MKLLLLLAGLCLSLSTHAATSQLKLELLMAERGDAISQSYVAQVYEYGTNVDKNLKESFKWYMKAAKQSHGYSQYKVGYFYEKGIGVKKNKTMALSWYKKAKTNGNHQATNRLNSTKKTSNEKIAKKQQLILPTKLEKKKLARKVKKITRQKKSNKKIILSQPHKTTKKIRFKKNSINKVKIPDIMSVVLNHKWNHNLSTADYLPSESTSCLQSGDNELTCFSTEKSRKIKGAIVTYTTKSTIIGFKSNGSFKVIYNYNAINISGAISNASDIYGLNMKEGWQKPAIAIRCRARDRKNITCFHGRRKVKFQG